MLTLPDNQKEFKFYRSFLNEEEAGVFTRFLDKHQIPYSRETSGTLLDSVIVGDGLVPKVVIKIRSQDFVRVRDSIREEIEALSVSDLKEHFLNQLSSQELVDILQVQDEWSVEHIEIAKRLLRLRGEIVIDEHMDELAESRYAEVRKGKRGSRFWMAVYGIGMLLGMVLSPLLIVAGIGMSWYYAYGKSVDPNGRKYFVFDEPTRLIGQVMLYGGIGLLVVGLLILTGIIPLF